MLRFVIRRLLILIPVLFALTTFAFFLLKLAPGDPATAFLGDRATPEAVAALRAAWGLDQPLLLQYTAFLRDVVVGDLGVSFTYQQPVSALLATRLPATLELILIAVVFTILISLPLSIWVATRRSLLSTAVVRAFNALFQGAPQFLVATASIAVFALALRWFPVGGFGDSPLENLHALILPGLVVALGIAPIVIRSLIASLGDALDADYTAFALSKGLPGRKVTLHYALRNGSISAVSILGVQVGFLIGGAVVVENVFAIPGVGTLLLGAVTSRDFPVVLGLTVVFGILVVGVALVTDLVYGALDPRARAGKAA